MSDRPRWIAGLIALVGVAGLLVGLRLLPAAEAGRASPLPGLAACDAVPLLGSAASPRLGAFFKLQARLDGAGTLVGQRLFVGTRGQSTASVDLPAESAASGPTGGVVTVVADDGRRSVVRLVAAGEGCASTIHETAAVVRRAIVDGADASLLLHEVDRATRADLGVWRLLPGGDDPVRIVEPLPASYGLGPVWATDLRLDANGRELAVQSCLDRTCLTRLVDLGDPSRATVVLRGTDQGPVLGFAGDRLVTWAACEGYPCAVLAWSRTSSRPIELVARATAAGVTADGRLLVAIVAESGPAAAVVVDLATGRSQALHALPAGDRPIATGGMAVMGLEVAPDQLAVAQPAGDPHAIRPGAAGEVLP